MEKVYDHKKVEDNIYKQWEDGGYFKPEANPDGEPYSIILPPPNANAPLHFGHAMYVIEDILVRYKRMRGFSALWLPGADHAGFETQFVYEKYLATEGKSRFDFDRETLFKNIWDFVHSNRGGMENQLRKLGFSLDWSRLKFTMDEDIVKIVHKNFKKLFDDGLAYRAERLVNYCTFDGTSFSDLEVVYEDRVSPLYYIKYGPLVLATTRPETKFGDTAVAVNPKDERYKKYVGKEIEIETVLGKAKIKVIADDYVDPEFGTGVVKITPAHDFNDFEVGKRHNLESRQVIGFDGKMNHFAGEFEGLYAKQARAKIVEKMQEKGLIEKIDENYQNRVALCYKCKNVIEPLPLEQWFIKMEPLAKPAIEAVKNGDIKIYPKSFEKLYFQFLENIRDWNISRQVVWGIRIPSFKCEKCSKWTVVDEGTPEKCSKCDSKKLTQDPDTFDTWFSSSQWPFATLQTTHGLPKMGFHEDVVPQVFKGKTKTYRLRDHGFKVGDKVVFENTQKRKLFGYGIITKVAKMKVEEIDYKDKTHFVTYDSLNDLIKAFKLRNPEKTATERSDAYLYSYDFHELEELENDFEKFYPTTVMETGYDILRWWVARMVMMGIYATGKVPFENIVLHGLVNDPLGKKMSKSKGNVVNPLELADEYGADAVRFALVYGTALGNDQSLSYPKLEASRRFTNKLWNMARFIEMNKVSGIKYQVLSIEELKKAAENEKDREWVGKVSDLVTEVTNNLEEYQFNQVSEKLYEFVWHQFADIYIEDVKMRIDDNSYLILTSLYLILLKLLHPIMPFVTEEIYGKFTDKPLIIETWPEA